MRKQCLKIRISNLNIIKIISYSKFYSILKKISNQYILLKLSNMSNLRASSKNWNIQNKLNDTWDKIFLLITKHFGVYRKISSSFLGEIRYEHTTWLSEHHQVTTLSGARNCSASQVLRSFRIPFSRGITKLHTTCLSELSSPACNNLLN